MCMYMYSLWLMYRLSHEVEVASKFLDIVNKFMRPS